mgnify:CR=1 FL=1
MGSGEERRPRIGHIVARRNPRIGHIWVRKPEGGGRVGGEGETGR